MVYSALSQGLVAAAAYPEKPIKLIVPSAAGSTPDVVARIVGERLATALGQPVIIDNRPGAIGTIGLAAVAKAAPDGYTLGMQTMPFIVAPSLLPKMPYDTNKDLQPVTLVEWDYHILLVRTDSPIRSVADLVAIGKGKPGSLTFSSPGNATPSHLGMALLAAQTGASLVHIPYKGTPAAITALLSGDVDLLLCGPALCSPHIKSGKFRALATTAPLRLAGYPELFTMNELGYRGVEIKSWMGLVATAGAPKEVVELLHRTIGRIMATPEVKERFLALGIESAGAGPKEFAELIRIDTEKWSKLVREARITAD
jgi:tripartite-type tricarboxylate transporter receptor subunit TctC